MYDPHYARGYNRGYDHPTDNPFSLTHDPIAWAAWYHGMEQYLADRDFFLPLGLA